MLIAAVFGRGVFYYLTIGSILLVLSLSANTAFADFPRLCRSIALEQLSCRTFSRSAAGASSTPTASSSSPLLTGALLILFGGITDRLIPLYAVGAFLAFTLSQFGMVVHWRKKRGPHWLKSALRQRHSAASSPVSPSSWSSSQNLWKAPGSRCSSFRVDLFLSGRATPLSPGDVRLRPVPHQSRRVMPLTRSPSFRSIIGVQVTSHGLELASRLTSDVIAVHVEPDEHSEVLHKEWDRSRRHALSKQPAIRRQNLVRLPSPYRFVIVPIVQYILDLSAEASRPPHRGGDSRVGRGPLVRIFSPQSARPLAGMVAPGSRQRAHLHLNAPYYIRRHS